MIPNPRLLIADDDELFREMFVIMFQQVRPHFQLSEARNGKEAYNHYRQHGVDLILTDDQMPLMNGLTLINTIRAEASVIPIIMLSSQHETRAAVGYDKHTVVASKPVYIPDLLAIIERMLTTS